MHVQGLLKQRIAEEVDLIDQKYQYQQRKSNTIGLTQSHTLPIMVPYSDCYQCWLEVHWLMFS